MEVNQIERPGEWAWPEAAAPAPDERSDPQWFALRVRAGSEKLIANIAENKGIESFLPLYQSRRRWSDRIKSLELPLFAGYLFCRLNPANRLPVLTIPGVQHFVGIGKVPVAIEDAEIEAIQAAVHSGLPTEPWPYLSVGQRVRLEQGPLSGLEGLLIEVRKQQRIVVSVPLLMRSVTVEIDRAWVSPALATVPPGVVRSGGDAVRDDAGGWRILAPAGLAGLPSNG